MLNTANEDVGRGMKGGKIEIGSDTRIGSDIRTVGPEMRGGQIIIKIKGKVTNVGYKMRGGIIKIVEGKVNLHPSCFNKNNKGKVFVGGKQVWPPQEKIS